MSAKKKFNLIDICIVLAAVVIAAACVFVLGAKAPGTQAETKTVVIEIREKTEDFCKIPQKGDVILDAATKQELGTLIETEKTEAFTSVASVEDAKMVKTRIPDRYHLYLTVEMHSMTQDAKIGKSMYIQGRTYACSGYIVDVVE